MYVTLLLQGMTNPDYTDFHLGQLLEYMGLFVISNHSNILLRGGLISGFFLGGGREGRFNQNLSGVASVFDNNLEKNTVVITAVRDIMIGGHPQIELTMTTKWLITVPKLWARINLFIRKANQTQYLTVSRPKIFVGVNMYNRR